ncbi:MAG TPA: hypothetical protein VL728_15415, partial [Cyclobacteriaceae bacterium]|nr:hypothetical protein [Cyclobacteriaceae bacterium]
MRHGVDNAESPRRETLRGRNGIARHHADGACHSVHFVGGSTESFRVRGHAVVGVIEQCGVDQARIVHSKELALFHII